MKPVMSNKYKIFKKYQMSDCLASGKAATEATAAAGAEDTIATIAW